jgi:hypothetical protein
LTAARRQILAIEILVGGSNPSVAQEDNFPEVADGSASGLG